ncbi:hypothetical protein [Maribacter sp. 2210JD10-5]|uniref:hypothetical protein n=1 Tax=Maribacter sp. 2210JD10-5 TaxID=3386272 RepID=UPI0039BD8F19
MNTYIKFFGAVLFLMIISCKEEPKSMKNEPKMNEKVLESNALVPVSWIKSRVEKAQNRLNQTDAGKVVWNAMEAHGGLEKWYMNGPLSFRFNYQPLDGSTQRDSYQTIDTWSNRAKHTSATDDSSHYGWTGDTSWVKAKDSTTFAYDTRFWALTPFYFLAQPFVLDGEGVHLELLPNKTYKEKEQNVVKVTFADGTGDAPDDYYVLYFTKDSNRLSAIRYIVSYPGYFKKGEHLPEKFMEVIGEKEVAGILFPTAYKTHWLSKDETPGEYITKIEVSDIHFEENLDDGFFEVPEGAKIIEGL